MLFLEKIISAYRKYPDRNAFCVAEQYYTYRDFFEKISAVQTALSQVSDSGQNIGLVVTDSVHTYSAYIAILLSGKTCVPIHPEYPAERVASIVEQAEISVVLSSAERTYDGVNVLLTSSLSAADASIDMAQQPPDTNAYILFTSGSTGKPKGVPITLSNLDSFVTAFEALGYEVSEQDRFLQMFDLTFDLSVMSFIIPLTVGACVYTVSDTGMKYNNIYNILETHNITFALMVPSVINYLRPYFEEIRLEDMRYSLFCGEALYKEVVTEWAACAPNARIENVYGPTEATIFCLTYEVGNRENTLAYNGIVTIGKPMLNMEAIVVDEERKPLKAGEKGELCLYGPQLTPGYLDDQKTKEAFFELDNKRYYLTGDIAFADEAGNFMYCGRRDNQVKVQGYRIELSEIEFHMRSLSGDANVVALLITSDDGKNHIEAVFEGNGTDTKQIFEQLKAKIPSYMLPSRMHVVDKFPLNANGKTDRGALKKMIPA